MSVVEEFWLQERIFRFFRLRHNVGTSELRRVAMLAGYLCKDGRLTESGRIFAINLNPKVTACPEWTKHTTCLMGSGVSACEHSLKGPKGYEYENLHKWFWTNWTDSLTGNT